MSAIPPATPPVAARTRGKTLVTATDNCASFVTPPLPTSSEIDALLAPPSPQCPSPNVDPDPVATTAPPEPSGPLDVLPRSTSPSVSPPLDPSWSLTFSPSLTQRATYTRVKTPSQNHHTLIPPTKDNTERSIDDQIPPPPKQQNPIVVHLSSSPFDVPPPPVPDEVWTCGFCEAHFPSRTECDTHLAELHILSQEREEFSPPKMTEHPELPTSPSPRSSPPVPTLVDLDNALFNIFNTPLPPKTKLFRCHMCGLQFDMPQKLRSHSLSHQTTPSLSIPIQLPTTPTTNAEAPSPSSPSTDMGIATPAACSTLPPPPATNSSVTTLPFNRKDLPVSVTCLDPPPPPANKIDDLPTRPQVVPTPINCPTCKAGPFANYKLRDLHVEFTHTRRSPRVVIQKEKIYTSSHTVPPSNGPDPGCAVLCNGPPKAPAFPKNPALPGPRISMPNPQVRPRGKTGRPRGRPPAARPPDNTTRMQDVSQDGIPGFNLSPTLISDHDPPKTPRPSPFAIRSEGIPHPTTDPPVLDETQVSLPASPASSQDLFLPRQPNLKNSNKRQPRSEPPPIGNKRNDPASIPNGPTRINDTLHLSFPISPALKCTEEDCTCAPFHAACWTASKQSLIRHLSAFHGILINNTEKWCRLCHCRTPSKVSEHSCFLTQPHVTPLDTCLRFKCGTCTFSSNTKRGLTNHIASHKRNLATPDVTLPQKANNRSRQPRKLITAAQKRASEDPAWRSRHRPDETDNLSTSNRFQSLADLPDDDHHSPNLNSLEAGSPQSNIPRAFAHPSRPFRRRKKPATRTTPLNDTPPSPSPPLPPSNDSLIPPSEDAPDPVDIISSPDIPPETSTDDSEDFPLQEFEDVLADIHDNRDDHLAWEYFERIVENITSEIGQNAGLPPNSDQPPSFTPKHVDTSNCRVIQRLYRRNRRRAIRLIVEGEASRCHIPAADITRHFSSVFAERSLNEAVLSDSFPTNHPSIDMSPFSPAEIRGRLHRFENSAPGPDRLSYEHLKLADPDCKIIAKIFNFCLYKKRIPTAWKKSKTILIHKKGDENDLNNWRPISLCNSLYKLYTGCLSSRLVNWITDFEILSPCQKGFLPFDGVFEHRFVLNHALTMTKRNKDDICLAQIDLTNAFGSIPHQAINVALQEAGAGPHFREIIVDLYSNSTTEFFAGDGLTEPISISAGVRQGCPISGILFNIVIDPVLRKLQRDREDFHVLAFADDISIIESSPEQLQTQLDLLSTLLNDLSLHINPNKCASFHLSGATPVGARDSIFLVNETPIPSLKDGEESSFLGTPVGFRLAVPLNNLRDFMLLGERIAKSKLAPWQRIDALKTFFFPAFVFQMRTEQLSKGDMKVVDDFIRPLIKDTLYVDESAANEYLYGSSKMGLLGIPRLADEVDIMMIDNAFKLLSSKDIRIHELAWEDILDNITTRTGLDPSPSLIEKYLNGTQDEEGFRHTSCPYASTWSRARAASTRLGVTWRCREYGDLELHIDDKVLTKSDRKKICQTLKESLRNCWANDLIAKPSQGAAIEVTTRHKASSHFLRSGDFTTFADWRFIHKERLNLLRLNGNTPWDDCISQCRRCNAPVESTLHVLSLCKPNMGRRTTRHNAIVERIHHAKRRDWQVLSKNQVLGNDRLRPDLVLVKGSQEAIILDVTVPYENRYQAFINARNEKTRKYANIAALLAENYKKKHIIGHIPQETRLHQQNAILASTEPENSRDNNNVRPSR
ncbi:hypothetical protein JTE90_013361 [Oedothorax gibbosus]|uniref:Reverse transcriptase n=1 Tax=Oedothorax gibbosus TaxID=931172 RepID=A0AAV6TV36_9ARAC|nr:hypothetical protein JTE90_013361 [Oedothorax gibbosus]